MRGADRRSQVGGKRQRRPLEPHPPKRVGGRRGADTEKSPPGDLWRPSARFSVGGEAPHPNRVLCGWASAFLMAQATPVQGASRRGSEARLSAQSKRALAHPCEARP